MAEHDPDDHRKDVPVCAIGASAGGVQALKEFFRQVPDDLGLAYVVIMHLLPEHPSALSEILSAVTQMTVLEVSDTPKLEPNRVYVIAPDHELVVEGDSIASRPFTNPRGQRAPIDTFFRSAASVLGDGVAVILSGAGSDGALGVRAIKEGGGVVLVQEPADAEFPMMPRSALASGVADIVAPIPRLVERLIEVVRSKEAVRSLPEESAHRDLQRIIGFLRTRTGHDFSGYKRASVLRRVSRRMQVTHSVTLPGYIDYMTANLEEAQKLFADLLISVTSFFRDPEAYEVLAKQGIPGLFDTAEEDGIRAWVAGCATGEEAYSLAILLLEEAERRNVRVPIQIFASDLDEGALATGREARFPAAIEADVSEERLARFFVKEGSHYRIESEVRDVVLFASHSVLKDPPFMRLDLISCRNLLIYMDRELQREVCALFAYGLKRSGLLFLGSAETADASLDLFDPVNLKVRLYRARALASKTIPVIHRMPEGHRPQLAEPAERQTRAQSVGTMHVRALEQAAPPSILVDRSYNALHLSPRAARFLLPSAGPVSTDVVDLIRPELRLDLRNALRRALDYGQPTLTTPLPVAFDEGRRRVILQVSPVMDGDDVPPSQVLVVLLDGGPVPDEEALSSEPAAEDVRKLRESLGALESQLAASKAEHETTIQDLKAANEELQSINEENRATAEELETSKEELQSMNEELRTVNAELSSKLESIDAAHSDLKNIVAATDVGTLFLDTKLRIRMFTPRVAELFNINESDIGRAITDFTHHLDDRGISGDVEGVLRDLAPVEREIPDASGRWFIMRLRPYRTIDERIEGAVVTFVDVTSQRATREQLRESEARQSFLLGLSDALRKLTEPADIQAEACRILADWLEADRAFFVAVDPETGAARLASDFVRADLRPADRGEQMADPEWSADAFRRGECVVIPDTRTLEALPDAERSAIESLGLRASIGAPLTRDGRWFGAIWAGTGAARDWSETDVDLLRSVADRLLSRIERATAVEALRKSKERFKALIEATSDVLYRMSPDWTEMLDLRSDELLSETRVADDHWGDRYIYPDDYGRVWERIGEAIRQKVPMELEHRVRRADDSIGWIVSRAVPILDDQGGIVEWFGAARDITDRRRSEEKLREARDALRLATQAAHLGWATWDFTSNAATWDDRAREILGLEEGQDSIADWMESLPPPERERLETEVEACLREGRPFDLEYTVVHPDESERKVHGTGVFQTSGNGEAQKGTGLIRDVTDLRRWEESQRLLIGELNHRVKNMLAVIQSIAKQTQRNTSDIDSFIKAFENRVRTLAKAHDILTRRHWSDAELEEIVHTAVETFAASDERVRIAGPKVKLGPDATISFAMALHELGTNALKYGALSVPDGRVDITWTAKDDGRIDFEWIETGGPEVVPPTRRGFGSRLLERGVANEVDGEVEIEYRQSGVRWHVEFSGDDSL